MIIDEVLELIIFSATALLSALGSYTVTAERIVG